MGLLLAYFVFIDLVWADPLQLGLKVTEFPTAIKVPMSPAVYYEGAQYKILKTNEGRILLRGITQEGLMRNAQTIKEWGKQSGRSECALVPRLATSGTYKMDITDCVPEHVLKNYNSEKGNCFGLAMQTSGFFDEIKNFNWPGELRFKDFFQTNLRSKACRRISASERTLGDVGIVGRPSSLDPKDLSVYSHAFIHLSDDLVYSKNGEDGKVRIQTFQEVYKTYMGRSCDFNKADPAKDFATDQASCDSADTGVYYFRCTPPHSDGTTQNHSLVR